MFTPPAPSLHTDNSSAEDFSCAYSVTSATLASQTDITSPLRSLHRCRTSSDTVISHTYDPDDASKDSGNGTLKVYKPLMYGEIYKQDDIVGQYLARRDAHITEGLQAPIPHYINGCGGYTFQGHQSELACDSYAYGNAQQWYPDPETIRHLHALHSLLPHISPERKLNALSSLEIDIVDGDTSQIFCRAVPKKMLVLFLGRVVVSKFIRTFKREDNDAWRGPPTEQKLVLPHKVTSAAAIKVLVSWMVRACKFATMHSMKPLRIPNNLFVACSLARTLEVLRLHRDAYRLDVAITQQFSSRRPIFAAEIETMWICLGENDKYVFACIRALGKRMDDPKVAEDLQGLAERCPDLYARLCDPGLNEFYRPQFGREWFGKVKVQSGEYLQADRSGFGVLSTAGPARLPLIRHLGDSRTPDVHMQGMRSLDPSAPVFWPAGMGE